MMVASSHMHAQSDFLIATTAIILEITKTKIKIFDCVQAKNNSYMS